MPLLPLAQMLRLALLGEPVRRKAHDFNEDKVHRDADGEFASTGGSGAAKKPAAAKPKPAKKPPTKQPPATAPVAAPATPAADPAVGRPSKPKERVKGATPQVLPWKDPPPPQGKKGIGKPIRPKGELSNTVLGDLVEERSLELGFRDVLPPGRRGNKSVKKSGSSIDVEWDHSGKLYEVKMCQVTAIDYRGKGRAKEVQQKLRFARLHKAEPFMMIAVLDAKAGLIHYYAAKEPGIDARTLSMKNHDYLGTTSLDAVLPDAGVAGAPAIAPEVK